MWAFVVCQLKVVLVPRVEEYIYIQLLESPCLVGGLGGSFSTAIPYRVKVNRFKSLSIGYFSQYIPLQLEFLLWIMLFSYTYVLLRIKGNILGLSLGNLVQ